MLEGCSSPLPQNFLVITLPLENLDYTIAIDHSHFLNLLSFFVIFSLDFSLILQFHVDYTYGNIIMH